MKKRWTLAYDLHSRVHPDKEKKSEAMPDKDPEEAGRKPDKICVGEHDSAAKTKDREKMKGPHMFHTQNTGRRICWE